MVLGIELFGFNANAQGLDSAAFDLGTWTIENGVFSIDLSFQLDNGLVEGILFGQLFIGGVGQGGGQVADFCRKSLHDPITCWRLNFNSLDDWHRVTIKMKSWSR